MMYISLMCRVSASMICICLIKSRDDLDQSQSITHLWGNQMKNGEIGRRRKKLTQITDTAFSTKHCQHWKLYNLYLIIKIQPDLWWSQKLVTSCWWLKLEHCNIDLWSHNSAWYCWIICLIVQVNLSQLPIYRWVCLIMQECAKQADKYWGGGGEIQPVARWHVSRFTGSRPEIISRNRSLQDLILTSTLDVW